MKENGGSNARPTFPQELAVSYSVLSVPPW
jgi:hypothetical protein